MYGRSCHRRTHSCAISPSGTTTFVAHVAGQGHFLWALVVYLKNLAQLIPLLALKLLQMLKAQKTTFNLMQEPLDKVLHLGPMTMLFTNTFSYPPQLVPDPRSPVSAVLYMPEAQKQTLASYPGRL